KPPALGHVDRPRLINGDPPRCRRRRTLGPDELVAVLISDEPHQPPARGHERRRLKSREHERHTGPVQPRGSLDAFPGMGGILWERLSAPRDFVRSPEYDDALDHRSMVESRRTDR